MPDSIAPALTPEEWAEAEDGELVIRTPYSARIPSGGYLNLNTAAADGYEVITTADLPALMALANAALPDDHPGKLTWEQVERLRELAKDVEAEWPYEHEGPRDAGFLRALAAALGSLLPPRTGGEISAPYVGTDGEMTIRQVDPAMLRPVDPPRTE